MILLIIGFVIGLLLSPILFGLISSLLIRQKESDVKLCATSRFEVSDALKHQIQQSLNNYSIEAKLKDLLLKNFRKFVGKNLIKNVKIKKICFGSAAPYLKHVKLLNIEEYRLLTQKKIVDLKSCAEKTYKDTKIIKNENENGIYSNRIIDFESLTNLTNFEDEIGSESIIKSQNDTTSNNISQKIKRDTLNTEKDVNQNNSVESMENNETNTVDLVELFNCPTFYGSISYEGSCCIFIDFELAKEVIVSASVVIKKIESNFILKIPIDNLIGFEFTLINTPYINLEVLSELEASNAKMLFKNMLSRFLKKSAISAFKSLFVFPNWYSISRSFLGLGKNIEFRPNYISNYDYDAAFSIAEFIMEIINGKYEIIYRKPNFESKRSCFFINEKNCVHSWTYDMQSSFFPQNTNNKVSGDFFNCMDKIAFEFEDLAILNEILPGYRGFKPVNQKNNITFATIKIYGSSIEFIRVVYKNNIIFLRNSHRSVEFFVFRLQNNFLEIFSFSDLFEIYFTNQRILDILRKLHVKFSNILNCQPFNKNFYTDLNSEYPLTTQGQSEHFDKIIGLENNFKEALRLENELFKKYVIETKIKLSRLKKYLKDDYLRKTLISEKRKIIEIQNQNANIKKIFLDNENNAENVICTLFEKNFIIDMYDDNQSIIVYRIKKPKSNRKLLIEKTRVCICNRTKNQIQFPNFFIEFIKIQESNELFYSFSEPYKLLKNAKSLKKEIKVTKGIVFLEFRTETEKLFDFEIFSCKLQKKIVKIKNICSSDVFRIAYPVDNDFITIKLKSGCEEDQNIKYKIINLPDLKNVLLDGKVRLRKNEKIQINFNGTPTHFIYWRKDES